MQTAQFDLHADIEQRHWWFVARRKIMRRLVERVLTAGDERLIVDVGCGTGGNIAGLVDDYRCVGIDTSRQAIERARQRFPQVQFIEGFAPHDLGPLAGEAEMVLLMDVLEHVRDDFALLSSLLAALQPGAQVLITVPADMRLWSPHDESFGHFRRYDSERLAKVWEGLPVKTRLLSHFNSRLYPLIRGVRTINRWRGAAAGHEGTDFRVPAAAVNAALTSVFEGEGNRLCGQLAVKSPRPYRYGVSLVALLEKQDGDCQSREKPANIATDFFEPAPQEEFACS